MKKIILMGLLTFGASIAFTQSLNPEVIVAGGDFFQVNGQGSLQGTIGETFTETIEGEMTLTQGFQQIYFILTPIFEKSTPSFSWKVYPNPTSDFVYFETDLKGDIKLNLMDLLGRILDEKVLQNGQSQLSLQDYPSAIYLLNLTKENQLVRSWKLKKVN